MHPSMTHGKSSLTATTSIRCSWPYTARRQPDLLEHLHYGPLPKTFPRTDHSRSRPLPSPPPIPSARYKIILPSPSTSRPKLFCDHFPPRRLRPNYSFVFFRTETWIIFFRLPEHNLIRRYLSSHLSVPIPKTAETPDCYYCSSQEKNPVQ